MKHYTKVRALSWRCLVLWAALGLSVPSAHALSDAQHRRMLKTSPAYAQADAELGRAWRALREALVQAGLKDRFDGGTNPPARGSVLAEQREWLRSGRDREAKALRGEGSEADGYAAATRRRAACLREQAEALTAPAGAAANRAPGSPAKERHAAYMEAAWAFVREHRMPDGRDISAYLFAGADFSKNSLAIRDVDGDGRPELLVRLETAPMAGMRESVFGFNEKTGQFVEKLSGFPGIEYFNNGCAKEGASHNQGLAGDHFWPFTLHKLNVKTGVYESMGFVDAWSEKEFPTDRQDKPFPKQIDAVDDSYIYFLHTDPEASFWDAKPVDTPFYRAWLDGFLGGSTPVRVDWVPANAKGLEEMQRQE